MYLVVYEQFEKKDPTPIIEELKKGGWAHYFGNTWVLATNEPIDALYSRLINQFDKADNLLIIEITAESAIQGWMHKEFWEWMNNTMPGWARRVDERYGRAF